MVAFFGPLADFAAPSDFAALSDLEVLAAIMNSSEILEVTIGYFKVSQIFYKIIREIGSVFNSGKKRETEIVLVLLPSWQPRAQAAP